MSLKKDDLEFKNPVVVLNLKEFFMKKDSELKLTFSLIFAILALMLAFALSPKKSSDELDTTSSTFSIKHWGDDKADCYILLDKNENSHGFTCFQTKKEK